MAVSNADLGKLVLRWAIGGLLLFHGVSKLQHGIGGIETMVGRTGLPSVLAYGVYVGEVLAPLALLAGWWTRAAAALVAVNMTVAILLARRASIFVVQERGGAWAIELELLFLLGAVAIALLGAGRYAVDGRRAAKPR
jgi:putative oxidoreductase